MTHDIVIRRATQEDRDIVAQFASTLLEFGSPAWTDRSPWLPNRNVLADVVSDQSSRTVVVIAQNGRRSTGFRFAHGARGRHRL